MTMETAYRFTDAAGNQLEIPYDRMMIGVDASGRAAPMTLNASGSIKSGGYGFDLVDIPATTNGAYSAGDMIGGYRAVEVCEAIDEPVLITGLQVIFKAAVQPNIRAVFFGATPVASLADNGAYSLDATDVLKVRRTLSSVVLGATYNSHGTPKSISLAPQPFVMKPIAGTKNIGYVLVDDTGVTLTSTADMQVRFSGMGI